ncbi:hypothetical protein ABMA27_016793 [Loxostege sticticalis]|uniref:Uncharacterized protein n=1 Tax=Loxostege sticticalis TaxID=481309 RepID=A0ABR3I3K8_LOXSC
MKTSHYDEVSDESLDASDDRPTDPAESEMFAMCTRPVRSSDPVESETLVARTRPVDIVEARPVEVETDVFVSSYAEPVDVVDTSSIVSPEEVSIRTVDPSERWSDSLMSLPLETVASEFEPIAQCDAVSEMYYTASSEVSLLSDTEIPERANVDEESLDGREKDDRKECVIAGHVAAMRERFESMTRTNTPCPDLMRSSSPSLDVFRNITPSPDRLG